ncbi:MAG: hypothetical protein JJT78_09335 [Leptospira sp.]|nr:hypothetical protein [Leptospira sp.]
MKNKKKTKNSKNIFSGWFSFFSKKEKNTKSEEEEIATPDSFPDELKKARIKYKNFNLTKSLSIGGEIQRKDYKVKKNSETLYRLEGSNYSIALVTGDSLQTKDGKITGIIRITEAQLNRALQREHSDLESFLDLWNPNLESGDNTRNWKKILQWNVFWKQQILLRLRPDTTALLLVSLDTEFESFVFNTATKKQKKILHDELFYLNQGKNTVDWNPYTKNKSLVDPDRAVDELYEAIEWVERKIEKEEA